MDAEYAPMLDFDSVTFWAQLHNVPDQCLNNIRNLVQVLTRKMMGRGASSCESGLRLTSLRPSHGAKLWSDGGHVGWALLKFEWLPNFCNWCGRVTHSERDFEVWIQGKGSLKNDDQ